MRHASSVIIGGNGVQFRCRFLGCSYTAISIETIPKDFICVLVFRCFAYNAEEIRVGRVPSGVVGKPVEFESMWFFFVSFQYPRSNDVTEKMILVLFFFQFLNSWRFDSRVRKFGDSGEWRTCDELRPWTWRSMLPGLICASSKHRSHNWGMFFKNDLNHIFRIFPYSFWLLNLCKTFFCVNVLLWYGLTKCIGVLTVLA